MMYFDRENIHIDLAKVNLEGEPASRFPLPTGTGKTRSPCLPFSGVARSPALRPRGRLPLGSLYERLICPVASHDTYQPLVNLEEKSPSLNGVKPIRYAKIPRGTCVMSRFDPGYPGYRLFLWRATSKRKTAAAAATLRELTLPRRGTERTLSHFLRIRGRRPFPSEPKTRPTGWV